LDIEDKAAKTAVKLVEKLSGGHCTLALAESCTAGLVSDLVARASGASAVLWGSFVCYMPGSKTRMLGIDGDFLEKHGLVSAETAGEMALRALNLAGVSISASVTGLAGPLGDGSNVPVGTVFVAVARQAKGAPLGTGAPLGATVEVKPLFFQGERARIRLLAATAVLEELLEKLTD
jgi:PncC family amidohydrolase